MYERDNLQTESNGHKHLLRGQNNNYIPFKSVHFVPFKSTSSVAFLKPIRENPPIGH